MTFCSYGPTLALEEVMLNGSLHIIIYLVLLGETECPEASCVAYSKVLTFPWRAGSYVRTERLGEFMFGSPASGTEF